MGTKKEMLDEIRRLREEVEKLSREVQTIPRTYPAPITINPPSPAPYPIAPATPSPPIPPSHIARGRMSRGAGPTLLREAEYGCEHGQGTLPSPDRA